MKQAETNEVMLRFQGIRIHSMWKVVTETIDEWISDGGSRLAAALAFYTLFSLSPILVILIALIGALYGEETARLQILAQAREFVGSQGVQIVQSALADAYASSAAATVFGIFGLLFGSTVVFVSLQSALNTIWGVAPKPGWRIWPFLKKRVLSFVMVLAS